MKLIESTRARELQKALYYITQYGAYASDDGIYEAFLDQDIEDADTQEELDNIVDTIIDILNELPNLSDRLNQYLYDNVLFRINRLVFEGTLDDLYEIVSDGEDDLIRNLDISIYDLFDNADTASFWKEIADEDLKENGIDANCLYWVRDLLQYDDEAYLRLNGYDNGFEEITDDDILDAIIDKNLIVDHLGI